MDQSSSMNVLFRVYEVLRSRDIECDVQCPGYIEFPNHPFVYSPNSKGSWLHMHQDKSSWTHLIAHEDPKVVAEAIHGHFSATKASG